MIAKTPKGKSEIAQMLAAICRELQKIMRDSPFFVPTREVGELIGAHWTTIANWLRVLEWKGIIRLAPGEIRKRGVPRSPRYFYCERTLLNDLNGRERESG